MKRFFLSLFLLSFVVVLVTLLTPTLLLAAPLSVTVDSATYAGLITLVCLLLTQLWKSVIAPKLDLSSKTAPWISMVLGIVGALIAGLVDGNALMTVLSGIACGGTASYTFNLIKSVGALLKYLGVTQKQ